MIYKLDKLKQQSLHKNLMKLKKVAQPIKSKNNENVYEWVKSIIYDRENSTLISFNGKCLFSLKLDEAITKIIDTEFAEREVKQYYCNYNNGTTSLIFKGDSPEDTKLGAFDYLKKLPDLDDYSEFEYINFKGDTKRRFDLKASTFNEMAPAISNLIEFPINLEYLRYLIDGIYTLKIDLFGDHESSIVFKDGDFEAYIQPFRIT